MKTKTITLINDRIADAIFARASLAGLSVEDFIPREIRRVIQAARERDELPPITRKYAGIAPSMSDDEFREFRRGYLTRKYE